MWNLTPEAELNGVDGLILWMKECCGTEERLVRQNIVRVRPYHFFRQIHPDKQICRDAFIVFVHYTAVIYITDDEMEKCYDSNEMEQICGAYDNISNTILEKLPEIPSFEQIKSSLQYLKETKLINMVTISINFVCRVSAVLLKYNAPIDGVQDFSSRLFLWMSKYLKAVNNETHSIQGMSETKLLRRRLISGGATSFVIFSKIASLSIGK